MTLSIIVPVYKVEPYLTNCLRSISEQRLEDFELILVDDGSPDRCGELCDEYARTDPRIKVLHKPNGGLSSARNAGLDIASGKYVTFIDSDDMVSPGTLGAHINTLLADPSIDILEYPVYVHYQSPRQFFYKKEKQRITGQKEIFVHWIHTHGYRHSYICNKIYKRELFIDIRFPIGKTFEDIHTLPSLLKKANNFYVSDYGIYYYYSRENSITATASYRQLRDLLEGYYNVWKELNKFPIKRNEILTFYLYLVNILIDISDYKNGDNDFKHKLLKQLSSVRFSVNELINLDIPKRLKYKNIALPVIGLKFHCYINKLFHKLWKMK